MADILTKIKEWHKESEDGNREWRTRGIESYDFYKGKQWASDDVSKLDSEGRPHLTLNQIFPIINLVSGFERGNKMQIQVYPKRGGMQPFAEILTSLAKHAQDTANIEYKQSMMFYDGIICGKGWIGVDISYADDPINGELDISRLSPFEIQEDPRATAYDLNENGRFIIRSYYWDKNACILNYPKKEKEIGEALSFISDIESGVVTSDTDTYKKVTGSTTSAEEINKHKDNIRECWWKDWQRRAFLIARDTLEVRMIHPEKLEDAKAIVEKSKGKFVIRERVVPILHKTLTMGEALVLEDTEDPLQGISSFPFFRYCPYWVDGHVLGMIDNLKDPQREINKRTSQTLHHINQTANSGWLGPENWEVESTEDVEHFGSKPGVSIHYKEGKKPERIEPARLSEGHITLAQLASSNLKIISAVNADLLGYDKTAAESGIAMRQRKDQGLLANALVFDNYKYTLQIFGDALVTLIREADIYSEEEIRAIIEEDKLNVDLSVLKSRKIGKYGIKVSRSLDMPTERMAQFQMLLEAAKAGIPIPADVILEASDIPHKEEVIARIKEQQAQQNALPPSRGTRPPTA